MTTAQRLADLEARVKKFEDFFKFGVSEDGKVPYVTTAGRVGVMSQFWAKQPVGQGAALSVGSAIDRFGVYAELEPGPDGFAACPDHPSTAFYGASVSPHNPAFGQPNIAFEGHAQNSGTNIALYGDSQFSNDPQISAVTPIIVGEVANDVIVKQKIYGVD